jgi:Extracellular link domain
MSWVTYTLLGVGIIMLIICIVYLSRPYVREGLLDYFDIEDYLGLLSTHNTVGRYVRIFPSEIDGGGYMSFSQIKVLDMNGTNVAKGKPVIATSTANTANVSVTVDGTYTARSGNANVWQTGNSTTDGSQYWQVDLGAQYQISQVAVVGRGDRNSNSSLKGMKVLVVDDPSSIVSCPDNTKKCCISDTKCNFASFMTNDINQTLTFSNAVDLTTSIVDPSSTPLNPLMLPLTNTQPEVFLVGPSVTRSMAEASCNAIGATLATSKQLTYAKAKGANWSTQGWVKDNNNMVYSTNGSGTASSAMSNCFGIKPNAGVSSNVTTLFDGTYWSEYSNTSRQRTYFGTQTGLSVPDIEIIRNVVNMNSDPTNQGQTGYRELSASTIVDGWHHVDSELNMNFYNILRNNAVYNFLADINYSPAATPIISLTALNNAAPVFGEVPDQARKDMADSLDLCRRIFVGSPSDVYKFINVHASGTLGSYTFKPTIRNTYGFSTYCKTEVDEKGFDPNMIGFNMRDLSGCSTELTSDMLALIPDPTRNFIIQWIYDRTKLFIEKQQYYIEHPPVPKNAPAGTTPKTPLKEDIDKSKATMTTNLAALKKMKPNVKINVTNTYILNSIAQSFYEAMGGNYIMNNIYDIFTVGNTILDIRFDLTKHGDIGPFQNKIEALKTTYKQVSGSNLPQNVIEKAKYDYENALSNLQSQETNNTYPPVTGVVARFFYTYSSDTGTFSILGLTLDAKAVTSFIPELNGGTQVSVGSDVGNLNFTPTIKYTLNIPERLDCSNPTVLKRVMSDYVDASVSDLAYPLYNATPSVDTSKGTIHVTDILGAVQVSSTQCAIQWKETLWDDGANKPVSTALTGITRNGLFTYTVNQDDWYGSDITLDASGFILYTSATVPQCAFDPSAYKTEQGTRLQNADDTTVRKDFITNAFKMGYGPMCPKAIPQYVFSPADYVAANPGLTSTLVDSVSGVIDAAKALKNYMDGNLNSYARASQAIAPLATPITIQQHLPPSTDLDNANKVCPTTNCQNFDLLYSLVDQYNSDPTAPGSILRVTKAYTPNTNQCDLEVDMNYDTTVKNAAGQSVKKGSFTYNSSGGEIPAKTAPPSGKKVDTVGISVYMDIGSCKIQYGGTEGSGTGTSILPNTPLLPKPMEYATEFQSRQGTTLKSSFDKITTSIDNAMNSTKTVLPPYKANNIIAEKWIATLGTNCTSRCDSTENINQMLQFYKTQNGTSKVIDSVLRMKPIDSFTCEMTFRELTPIPGTTDPNSSTAYTCPDASYTLNGQSCVPYPVTTDPILTCPDPNATLYGTSCWLDIQARPSPSPRPACPAGTTQTGGGGAANTKCVSQPPAIPATPPPPPHPLYSTKTSGMLFTMGPGNSSCTFSVRAMTPTIPSRPPTTEYEDVFGMKEVFCAKGTITNNADADATCKSYGATLASTSQLNDAQKAGASWNYAGVVLDDTTAKRPSSSGVLRTVNADGKVGAVCYGTKPPSPNTNILPFSDKSWYQYNALDYKQIPYTTAYKASELKEVFGITGNNYTQSQAQEKCTSYAADLATYSQVVAAQAFGAGWCSFGWIKDDSENKKSISSPVQISNPCWNGSPVLLKAGGVEKWGATCYGVKPSSGTYTDVLPFSTTSWSQPEISEFSSSLYVQKEVFYIDDTGLNHSDAVERCARLAKAEVATLAQVTAAQKAGASWCGLGWVSDDDSNAYTAYPDSGAKCLSDSNSFSGIQKYRVGTNGHSGAICYGVKPVKGVDPQIKPFSGNIWNQYNSDFKAPYANPYKEFFTNYKPIQVTESTFPLNKESFGIDIARNRGGPGLDTLFVEPLRQESKPVDSVGPKYVDADDTLKGEKASSYKYIRFRPTKTRDPSSPTVNISKISFYLKKSEIDIRSAKVTNPMGTWVGDVADVNGPGFTSGWSDKHKRALVFAFPYALLMDGFSWTTANPEKGLGGDPVEWKLEGSTNGTYWTTLRDQSHKYPVPVDRFSTLPVFRF